MKLTQESAFEEVYSAVIARPSEIMSLAFDAASNYLATANQEGVVQLYTVEENMRLRNIFSVALGRDDIPRAVAFGQMGGNTRTLLVFGLHHGTMYVKFTFFIMVKSDGTSWTLRSSDGRVDNTIATGTMM